MEIITLTILALAILMFIMSRLMAAQDTMVTVPDNVVYCGGGDPAIVYLTAEGGITPGDNVQMGAAATGCDVCADATSRYLGTADRNENATIDGNNPMTHDYATGEAVAVITGNCHVRKLSTVAVGVSANLVQMIGTLEGENCHNAGGTAISYLIGRAITDAAAGNAAFVMHQW